MESAAAAVLTITTIPALAISLKLEGSSRASSNVSCSRHYCRTSRCFAGYPSCLSSAAAARRTGNRGGVSPGERLAFFSAAGALHSWSPFALHRPMAPAYRRILPGLGAGAAGGGGDGLGAGSGSGGGGGGGDGGSSGGQTEKKSLAGESEDLAKSASDAIILDVGGMSCAGCTASVKRILESLPQVSSASVDLATETAVVWATPEAKATPNWQKELGDKLAKHLTTCGFKSNLRGGEHKTEEGVQY